MHAFDYSLYATSAFMQCKIFVNGVKFLSLQYLKLLIVRPKTNRRLLIS